MSARDWTFLAVVLVVTCRALKLHGGVELDEVGAENVEALTAGFANARSECGSAPPKPNAIAGARRRLWCG